MKRNHLAWALACTLGAVGATNAQSTSIAFVAHANSLAGTVVHYDASGTVIGEAQIAPQAEATTDMSGSDTESDSTSSGSALGLHVYDITTPQNSTSGCNNTSDCDQTSATSSASTLNLFGGLVTVALQTTTLNGVADSTTPDQVDITAATVSATAIVGTGISVAPGTYSAGTAFPVSGPVSVPVLDAQGNPTGSSQSETFTGQLRLALIQQGSDSTTGASVFDFSAEQLTGTIPDGTGGYYQITLGGPLNPPSPGNGSGPTYAIDTTPAFHITG